MLTSPKTLVRLSLLSCPSTMSKESRLLHSVLQSSCTMVAQPGLMATACPVINTEHI